MTLDLFGRKARRQVAELGLRILELEQDLDDAYQPVAYQVLTDEKDAVRMAEAAGTVPITLPGVMAWAVPVTWEWLVSQRHVGMHLARTLKDAGGTAQQALDSARALRRRGRRTA